MLKTNSLYTNYLDKLLNQYLKNNQYYRIYFYKRFFTYKLHNLYNLFAKPFYDSFFIQIFHDTIFFKFSKIYELNLLFYYLRNNFYTIRLFLGYPRHSRTRSNGKSSIQQSILFKNIVIKYIYYRIYKKHKDTDKVLLLFVDFFNKLWFFQWYNEWRSSKLQLEKAVIRKFFKWKFGYLFLSYNRPIVFVPKKSKQKSNKRKQIEVKNTYNIGFYLGFTNQYKEVIKRFNIFTKKTNRPKIKKKYLLNFFFENTFLTQRLVYYYYTNFKLTKRINLFKSIYNKHTKSFSNFCFLKNPRILSKSHLFNLKKIQFLFKPEFNEFDSTNFFYKFNKFCNF